MPEMPPLKAPSNNGRVSLHLHLHRLSAVSHDIWLFTNDRLTAECSWSNSDLAFYHEWPSVFNSGRDPESQHIFSHQDTVHLTVTWIKAFVPSHRTDQ